MASEKDYVPGADAAFDGWFENLARYVIGKTGGTTPQWAFIPVARVAELRNRPCLYQANRNREQVSFNRMPC